MNTLSSNEKTYEYYFYIPDCVNMSYTIIAFHNINENKEGNEETINKYFTRKTNTNYYIEFENLPKDDGNFILNNEIINLNSGKIKF